MGRTAVHTDVLIEEADEKYGPELLENLSQERFGMSWDAFYAAYQRGDYVGTDAARVAEQTAFLARFAR